MITKIGIIGAGTMGQSIATAFAMFNFDIYIYEPDNEQLRGAKKLIRTDLELMAAEGMIEPGTSETKMDRVSVFSELKPAIQDREYIIEAAPEQLQLKQALLEQLDQACPAPCILASNTSSLQLEEMMLYLPAQRKKRTMINHWYNPAHLIPIAELSDFGNLEPGVFQRVQELYLAIEKQPVRIVKELPGLVANRIQAAIAREVFSLIEQGVASPADIDKALKYGPAFRYATAGQLEIADFGGLDVWNTVAKNLLPVINRSQSASPILAEKIRQGKLGFKSGEGFFSYKNNEKEAIKRKYYQKLITQLKASRAYE